MTTFFVIAEAFPAASVVTVVEPIAEAVVETVVAAVLRLMWRQY